MTKISEHFAREEFACKCGCGQDAVDVELINVLEEVRSVLNAPIIVTSGNRCVEYNREIGGTTKSQHVVSKAADIVVEGHSSEDVYEAINSLFPDKYGIGVYPRWVHIDVRKEKARWIG